MAAHPAAAWRCANGREPLDDPARRTGDARCRRGAASFTPPVPVAPLASTAIPATGAHSRPVIDIRHIHRIFESEAGLAHILHDVSLTVSPGEFVAITGPSGSGKSTLMNILGCLDTPTSGTYLLEGLNVAELTDDELAEVRALRIGFVFQSFNLGSHA